ncbi:GntR family transcriptional regulator [Antricoccus suffuscus]|uniref:GntR family transcriptional regulator n=1 Tax=Antricoccus suffuscus TaxID=1629062 RepID=A0A2T0YYQ8_9ACTN|nr:GntR family transcriptional regulator [Antricoccus suffuscus]PRZ29223.1 GntR family transcriptional regulator [Antricoccus suffuscus]
MRTASRSSLITQVTESLREQIREGSWPLGSRIPTEPELADLTGTGRNTVREAVQALVHAGMLERRQGSGTYVVAESEISGVLGRRFALARRREVLELRQALDVTAAGLAARRRTAADVATLTDLLAQRNAAFASDGDRESMTERDVALHRAIVHAAHNPLYAEVYDSLLDTVGASIREHLDDGAQARDVDHDALVGAIVDGDDTRAIAEANGFLSLLISDTDSAIDD